MVLDHVLMLLLASEVNIIKEAPRTRREGPEGPCDPYGLSDSSEKRECTPGSMYIIRCKQCICPYMGNINAFCRPLPDKFHCEQPYPFVHFDPMARRNNEKANGTTQNLLSIASNGSGLFPEAPTHSHTAWSCEAEGRVMDECFVCECLNGVIIQEHCFRSDSKNCFNSTPTFLKIKLPE